MNIIKNKTKTILVLRMYLKIKIEPKNKFKDYGYLGMVPSSIFKDYFYYLSNVFPACISP